MKIELLIKGAKNQIYQPLIVDDLTWETERRGAPSQLKFTVVKDNIISFPEGCPVNLLVDGAKVFVGYVFQKSRNKDQLIECVAYDQLRYFKNKDIYLYKNKSASDVLKMIASDHGFQLGTVEDTGFKISERLENMSTLFDVVLNAIDLTAYHTKKLFVLYDDFGKICLRNIESMKLDLIIEADTAEDFDYRTSIDEDTYTKVILIQGKGNEKSKAYVAPKVATDNMKNWGTLVYMEKVDDNLNAQERADQILSLKNRKTKHLTIKNACGDIRVRAGCSINLHLNLGDTVENRVMVCEKVTHYLSVDFHTMDITLRDGTSYV